ncbi:hypothetical protein EDB86DRAFT_2948609 [Lactarius hatsudake]|nr:hypothetical protein EDB86DRAFT_2948609 [Lactarius hatsudake]
MSGGRPCLYCTVPLWDYTDLRCTYSIQVTFSPSQAILAMSTRPCGRLSTAKIAADNAGGVEFTGFSLHGPDTSENCVNTIPQLITTSSTDYQRSVPAGMAASARSTFGPDPKSCGYQTQVVHGRHFPAPAPVPFKLLLPGPTTLYHTIITFTLLAFFFFPPLPFPRLVPLPSTLPSTFHFQVLSLNSTQHESTWCINTVSSRRSPT